MRVLVICTSFPPANVTGVHRTLALVKWLFQCGHQMLVLTTDSAGYDRDESLLAKVPPGLQIVRTRCPDLVQSVKDTLAWPVRSLGFGAGRQSSGRRVRAYASSEVPHKVSPSDLLSWCAGWLQFPDPSMGWLFTALRNHRLVRAFRPDVIYSSAPTYTSHFLGLAMHRLLGVPWAADCRDPWRANPYRRFPFRAHDMADGALEAQMVRHAGAVVCNTTTSQREFQQRYPGEAGKFSTIYNGYDEAEAADLGCRPRRPDGVLRFAHAGGFYGHRSPEPYFRALAMLVDREPKLRSQMRFQQIGPTEFDQVPMQDIAKACGVADMLELSGTLSHRDALQAVARADIAVAASQSGPNGHLQIPRKFYEYYGLGKPMLICGGSCAAIRELFDGRGMGDLLLVDEPQPAALAAAMRELLEKWRRGDLRCCTSPALDLTDGRMARQLEQVLGKVAVERSR